VSGAKRPPLTRLGRRSLSFRILSLALGLLFALGAAEVGLRLLGERRWIAVRRHHQLLCRHDPLLGWMSRLDAVGRHTTVEFDVVERLNERGLRGPVVPYARDPKRPRVMLLGDSFVEGYTVALEDTVGQVVQRSLARQGFPGTEVVSAGIGGWSTDQELLFFREEGRRYGADIVVLVFHDNDVWYNDSDRYWRGRKPHFELDGSALTLTGVPVPPPLTEVTRRIHDSYLIAFVRDRLRASVRLRRLASRLGLASPERPISPDDRVLRGDPETDLAWRLTEALLVALQSEVARSGGVLLSFHAPRRETVETEAWSELRSSLGAAEPSWDPDRVQRRLRRIARRHGVGMIEPERLATAARSQTLYFPIDGHWNVAGHHVAGEIIADHLALVLAAAGEDGS